MASLSKILQGFRFELAARATSIVSGITLTVYLARTLGTNSYGLLSLALSVLSFAVLGATLGFPQSAARYVAEFRQTDRTKIRPVLRTAFLFIIGSTALICVVLIAFGPLLEDILNADGLRTLLIVGIFYTVFHSISKYPRRIFQSFSDIRLASVITVIIGVGNLVCIVPLVYFGLDAFGALVGYTITSLVVTVFGLWKLYTKYYCELPSEQSFDQKIAVDIFRYNLSLSATSGARAIEKKADILMIGFFLSPVAVAAYTVSKQITTVLSAPAEALGFTLSPMYSEEKISGNSEQAAVLYREALSRVILLYLPGIVGLIIVAEPTIRYIFGSKYLSTVPALRVLAVVGILEAIGNITASGLDYLGRAKRRAQLKLAAVLLNVGLNVVLITNYGITGAAIGTVLAYSIYIFGTVGIMQYEIDFLNRILIRKFVKISLVSALMGMVVFYFEAMITGVLSLLLVVLLGIICWGISSASLGLISREDIRMLAEAEL